MDKKLGEFLGFCSKEIDLINKENDKSWFIEQCVGLVAVARGLTGGCRYVKSGDREMCYIYERDGHQEPLYIVDITHSNGWGIITMVMDCFEGRKRFIYKERSWISNYVGVKKFEPKEKSYINEISLGTEK